ncbi:MAG TPA: TetR/AcrR family transcriptional regulator [Longimicrobiales bacterium]|nr:TetR/AcrR family transcriptional regulator [Longimicrobiales bacterium]
MAPDARAPGDTRRRILEAAFHEFYLRGFQAGSLDSILTAAGVTKGALYHHFRDKAALGYAVLEEVVREPILDAYLAPLAPDGDEDPLAALQGVLRRRPDDFVETGIGLGCPLNNLTQEMSPLDEGFRTRVAATLETWTGGFADAIRRSQEGGFVRADVDTRRIAGFVVACIEGAFGAAKAADSVDVLRANLEVLADFLDTLRLTRSAAGRRRADPPAS